ncbi:MAG: hydroxymethylbilane synthase [Burkholderiales bacterium]|nr:MAG: hydroxymethylbilane synthase [Burkholderiales bacterium]
MPAQGATGERQDRLRRLVIATRESRLALWQARHVQQRLIDAHGAEVELLGMTTKGDRVLDRALAEIGGKGLFTKELELALLDRRADLAVHSLKDVPMLLEDGFELAAVLAREDPRDALVSPRCASLEEMPRGARVGTSSVRRAAILRSRFPDLEVLPLRGNLDTRLAKLDRGEYDAVVLAASGLKRLGLADRIRAILPPSLSLPAPGQGALGIEIRAGRDDVLAAVGVLDDERTRLEVTAERSLSRRLGGSCRIPLAAYCTTEADSSLLLRAMVASEDGRDVLSTEVSTRDRSMPGAEALGAEAAQALRRDGADRLLAV